MRALLVVKKNMSFPAWGKDTTAGGTVVVLGMSDFQVFQGGNIRATEDRYYDKSSVEVYGLYEAYPDFGVMFDSTAKPYANGADKPNERLSPAYGNTQLPTFEAVDGYSGVWGKGVNTIQHKVTVLQSSRYWDLDIDNPAAAGGEANARSAYYSVSFKNGGLANTDVPWPFIAAGTGANISLHKAVKINVAPEVYRVDKFEYIEGTGDPDVLWAIAEARDQSAYLDAEGGVANRKKWLSDMAKSKARFTVKYLGDDAFERTIGMTEFMEAVRKGYAAIVPPKLDDVYDELEVSVKLQYYDPEVIAKAPPSDTAAGVEPSRNTNSPNTAVVPLEIYQWDGETIRVAPRGFNAHEPMLHVVVPGRRRDESWENAIPLKLTMRKWIEEVNKHYDLKYVHTSLKDPSKTKETSVQMLHDGVTVDRNGLSSGITFADQTFDWGPIAKPASYPTGAFNYKFEMVPNPVVPGAPGSTGAAGLPLYPVGVKAGVNFFYLTKWNNNGRVAGHVNYDPAGDILPEGNVSGGSPYVMSSNKYPSPSKGFNINDSGTLEKDLTFELQVYPFGGRVFGTAAKNPQYGVVTVEIPYDLLPF